MSGYKGLQKLVKRVNDEMDQRRIAKYNFSTSSEAAIEVSRTDIGVGLNKATEIKRSLSEHTKKTAKKRSIKMEFLSVKQEELALKRESNKELVGAIHSLGQTKEDKDILKEICQFIYDQEVTLDNKDEDDIFKIIRKNAPEFTLSWEVIIKFDKEKIKNILLKKIKKLL